MKVTISYIGPELKDLLDLYSKLVGDNTKNWRLQRRQKH